MKIGALVGPPQLVVQQVLPVQVVEVPDVQILVALQADDRFGRRRSANIGISRRGLFG